MHSHVLYFNIYRRYLDSDGIRKKLAAHCLGEADQGLSLNRRGILIDDYDRPGRIRVLVGITQCPVGSDHADHAKTFEVGSIPLPSADAPGHYGLVSYQVYL